eukprot:TRINITY_DN14577_c0_g1_i1.p1 TRINITY_DN14577_c0_g1~~TRINITY_DN14577_c0_g1_i1.p1  ORF type:complete len:489 (+),score=53.05 TRINITY_DN14577_c0_g1_i1:63-1529(+)
MDTLGLPSTIQQLLSDVVNVNDESRGNELSVVPTPVIPRRQQRGSILVICGDGIQEAMDHQEGGWLCTLSQIYRNSLNISTWDTTGMTMPQIAKQAVTRISEEHGPNAQLRCILIVTGADDMIKNTIINDYCLALADVIETAVKITKVVPDPRIYFPTETIKPPPIVVMSSPPLSLQPFGDIFEQQLALASAASGIATAQRDSGGVDSPVYFIDQLSSMWRHPASPKLFCGGVKHVLTSGERLKLNVEGNDTVVENIIKLFTTYRQDLLPKTFNPSEIPIMPLSPEHDIDKTVHKTALMDLIEGESPNRLAIPKSVYDSFSVDHDVDTIISKVAKELNMPTTCAFKPAAKTCPDCGLPLTIENGDRLPFCSVSGEVHEVSYYDSERVDELPSEICSDCRVHRDTHPFCTSTGRPHHSKNFPKSHKQNLKEHTRNELLSRPIGAVPRQLTTTRPGQLPAWSSRNMPVSGLDPLNSLPALLMTPGGYSRN